MSRQTKSDFNDDGKIRIFYRDTNVVTEMSIEHLYQNFKQRLIKEVNETPNDFMSVPPVKPGPDA